ncbi:MAG: TIGR00730 family Rossman fold protein [Desulfomicrobium sp.]|nr:TIGR00730 family Rossman fold protein [Pseudomonadota bacterium]MBV1711818.1 TIGR00730 family Rossman fold protein [Desulfomicrobium sp.]MBU4572594.1 TIGR00730 family Rossman fold protein [Pseudomonadota bacterium]MBU4593625.1 TIGR00730 family Rossman fold protein [Pseudomonadota bacterium]MBV1719120.1 TIGR00730 family Rossman fold protein [Desulfomicrobium sp.]
MTNRRTRRFGVFPTANEDAQAAKRHVDTPQCQSESYRLAFQDQNFLLREELRPVRLQLELLKPELALQEQQIESTIVIYGSARIVDPETAATRLEKVLEGLKKNPDDYLLNQELSKARAAVASSRYYEEARKLGRIISENVEKYKHVVITGGGFGIMGAANQGAHDVGAKSIGMNIVLPFEQEPNPYITPELSFQFHYFAIRKMHLLMRAKALVAFPGGFGTMDELFEALTLIQTCKVKPIPVLLFGRRFWRKVVNFEALVEEGTISPEDLNIFQYVSTAEEAWEVIASFNGLTTAGKP